MTTDIKAWYKQTKIGIIPNDWSIDILWNQTTFSQWIQVGVEKQISSMQEWYVRFIRIVDYTQKTKDIRYIQNPWDKYRVDKDDIVMIRYWTPWVIWRWISGIIANNMFKIESNDIQKDYLVYYLSQTNIQNIISKNSGSSTMPAVNFGTLKWINIIFPTNPAEQEKIADILSSVDELIEKTDKVIETQKKLKDGLLSKLMREGKNIKTNKLKNIAKFSQWIQVDLEQQKTHHSEWYMRFLRIVDYTQETKDLRYIIFPWERYVANEDDVVMVRYWASAWFIGTGKKWVIANNMFKVEPNWDVLKKYLYFFLKQNKIGKLITQMSTASAMPQLNFTMVGSIEITYPEDIKDQEKIIDILTTVDNSIIDEEHYKDSLKILKKWLMDKLLIGEIRVKI